MELRSLHIYRRAMALLFFLCLLAVLAFASFWKLAANASVHSNVGLYGEKYVPAGMDSYDYSTQQNALANRYSWAGLGSMLLAVATLSAGVTLGFVVRHEKRPKA
jgi:hypothetical protein